MYVHPYFSLDERRLEVRVGDFALHEGVEVVVCGVKKQNKTKKTALSFLLFERTTMGPQNDVQEGI